MDSERLTHTLVTRAELARVLHRTEQQTAHLCRRLAVDPSAVMVRDGRLEQLYSDASVTRLIRAVARYRGRRIAGIALVALSGCQWTATLDRPSIHACPQNIAFLPMPEAPTYLEPIPRGTVEQTRPPTTGGKVQPPPRAYSAPLKPTYEGTEGELTVPKLDRDGEPKLPLPPPIELEAPAPIPAPDAKATSLKWRRSNG